MTGLYLEVKLLTATLSATIQPIPQLPSGLSIKAMCLQFGNKDVRMSCGTVSNALHNNLFRIHVSRSDICNAKHGVDIRKKQRKRLNKLRKGSLIYVLIGSYHFQCL